MIWKHGEPTKKEKEIAKEAFRQAYLLWGVDKDVLMSRSHVPLECMMRQIVQASLMERNLRGKCIADSMKVTLNTVSNRKKKHLDALEDDDEYKENFLAFRANLSRGVYGGDPHPNTSSFSSNLSVFVPIDRKSTPNAGGFSDPTPDCQHQEPV